VLSEACELWIRTGASKDSGIAFGESAPALALKRTGDDRRPAASSPGIDDLVDEVNKIVWKPNRYLLAHPIMVAKWEQAPAPNVGVGPEPHYRHRACSMKRG
jgi:hypothetical protein